MQVLLRHELRRGRRALLIWTASVAFLLGVCIVIYPEMGGDMEELGDMFAQMGSFTAAFGMDKVNFGSFEGFFAVECGNILGLGGALFAALTAATALSREENEHTAEFLLTHPIPRRRVVSAKLLAVLWQVFLLNALVALVAALGIAYIGQDVVVGDMALLFAAYLLMQWEIAALAFALSALLRQGSVGAGMGLALGMYFLNLLANMTDSLDRLHYLTPFAYADGADILTESALHVPYLVVGLALGLVGVVFAHGYYGKKDIR